MSGSSADRPQRLHVAKYILPSGMVAFHLQPSALQRVQSDILDIHTRARKANNMNVSQTASPELQRLDDFLDVLCEFDANSISWALN